MMFQFHAALSLGLLALTAGAALTVLSKRVEGCAASLAKLVGMLVMVISLISTVCTIYCGVRYGMDPHAYCPMHMQHPGMGNDKAMDATTPPAN